MQQGGINHRRRLQNMLDGFLKSTNYIMQQQAGINHRRSYRGGQIDNSNQQMTFCSEVVQNLSHTAEATEKSQVHSSTKLMTVQQGGITKMPQSKNCSLKSACSKDLTSETPQVETCGHDTAHHHHHQVKTRSIVH